MRSSKNSAPRRSSRIEKLALNEVRPAHDEDDRPRDAPKMADATRDFMNNLSDLRVEENGVQDGTADSSDGKFATRVIPKLYFPEPHLKIRTLWQ